MRGALWIRKLNFTRRFTDSWKVNNEISHGYSERKYAIYTNIELKEGYLISTDICKIEKRRYRINMDVYILQYYEVA